MNWLISLGSGSIAEVCGIKEVVALHEISSKGKQQVWKEIVLAYTSIKREDKERAGSQHTENKIIAG